MENYMDEEMLAAMADEAQAEQRVEIPKDKDTNKQDISATEDVELAGDDQDFSHTPWDEREHPDTETEHSQTNTETETNTETNTSEGGTEAGATTATTGEVTSEEDVNAWLSSLPTPPPELALKKPEFDEDGFLTNMTGPEFLAYTQAAAVQAVNVENYNNTVLNRSLDEAEKILPDIKTNPRIREMVENQYVAKTLNGESYNLVAAARDVRQLIGGFKDEGARNAKVHITVQKNAAVETPSNQRKSDPSKVDKLAKRLKAGDKNATEDLFALWLEEGKI